MKTSAYRFCTLALRIGSFAMAALCANVDAGDTDDFIEFPNFESFGIQDNDFVQMQIVPVAMMETHTLFLAAQIEREARMSPTQRLMNNRWLINNPDTSFSGAEALRRYLKLYFIRNWKAERNKAKQKDGPYLVEPREAEQSQFTDISNYRLRISNDRVRIRFRYRFE